jgi:hypothetical protein
MGNKYQNARSGRIADTGGAVRVTLVSNVGQGNGGTSLPCKGCWVSPASDNDNPVRINIGTAASATLGIELSDADIGHGPLFIPIDDVAKLYFYSADAVAVIDILYLRG